MSHQQAQKYRPATRQKNYSLLSISSTESQKLLSRSGSRPLPLESACIDDTLAPELKLGIRVVWMSDDGPEYGCVRWLGKLPDTGSDWMAGIEFDNPVGTGTGRYNNRQLFVTKLNHASLVPVIGLIKAEDFEENRTGPTSEGLLYTLRPSRSQSDDSVVATTRYSSQSSSYGFHATMMSSSEKPNARVYSPVEKPRKKSVPLADEKNKPFDSLLKIKNLACQVKDSTAKIHNKEQTNIPSSALVSSGKSGNKIKHKTKLEENKDFLLPPRSCEPPKIPETNTYRVISVSQPVVFETPFSQQQVCSPYKLPQEMLGIPCQGQRIGTSRESYNILTNTSGRKKQLTGLRKQSVVDNLEVGSVVEVLVDGFSHYGVIRWIGQLPEDMNVTAGVEMEEEIHIGTDGMCNGHRYFHCPPRKAVFVRLSQCKRDSRFLDMDKRKSAVFGSIDSPSVMGDIPPLSNLDELQMMCGKFKGIQGHHNSCYLDATLFAMFAFTSVFDSLLHRPARFNDIVEYSHVQRVLKESIVNPLRKNMYVRADRVMQLRTLLDELGSIRGLTSEEKDPEEFLNSLLNQILKAEPFLKLSSGQDTYLYQLFVEKDDRLKLPTVQQLFDQSFLASDIKLQEVPPSLLIQMPRFGKQFKMYPRIIPSQYLNISDVLADSPRQCIICGQVAEYECKECFGQFGDGLESTAFCQRCLDKSHGHQKRAHHTTNQLCVPQEFRMIKDHTPIPKIFMELFAVVCIETSHYVCFVKCGSGPDSSWCFFDSMADRKGEQNGYNIPEVIPFPELHWWLSEEGKKFLLTAKDDKILPDIARRLLCDAYMCMYQSPDIMMYR
ncbi:ubiquitin carboxyl-terminal hydrolase CYLD-like isoform X2 [Limulus polyphemus]|nr:ubiquitin carboxyl-terminal hydrolase CYLD-like isoform X2 [Limulus polyphemus]